MIKYLWNEITVILDNYQRIIMSHFYFYFIFISISFEYVDIFLLINVHIVVPDDDPRKGYESSNHLLLFLF